MCLRVFAAFLVLVCREVHGQGPLVITAPINNGTQFRDLLHCNENVHVTNSSLGKHDFFRVEDNKNNTWALLANKNWDESLYTRNESCSKVINKGFVVLQCGNGDPTKRDIIINPSNNIRSVPWFCDANSCGNLTPSITVNENVTVGQTLLEFKICDKDLHADTSTPYDVTVNDTYFKIQTSNDLFKLKLNHTLDYKVSSKHVLRLSVDNRITTMDLTVNIKDVDDLGVQFSKNVYNCGIPENYNGSTNCTVLAEDQDKGIGAKIGYSILSVYPPAGNNAFEILANGTIDVTVQLDRENISEYTLFIKGYQTGRPADRVNYTSVVISVEDKDDNPPVLGKSVYKISINENARPGTLVVRLSASDVDEGDNANFIFRFNPTTRPHVKELLSINDTTGDIMVIKTLDRESIQGSRLRFQVRVIPTVNTSLSASATVEVNVLDENDNDPVININSTNITIKKTFAVNGNITTFTVTDADEGDNARTNVALDKPQGPFELVTHNQTHTINLANSLNESFEPHYQLIIRATDLAQNVTQRRFSITVLNINVQDVNSHSPAFANIFPKSVSVPEDTRSGAIILQLSFQGSDVDPTDNLTFSLTVDPQHFCVQSNAIVTTSPLDRERISNYTLNVSLSDGLHTIYNPFTVHITDVNDNNPQFVNKTYTFHKAENDRGTLSIGVVEAKDIDNGLNGTVEYILELSSTWTKNVTINKASGMISSHGSLDREDPMLSANGSMVLVVYAQDKGNPPRSSSTVVNIVVIDINDNHPVFDQHEANITINEAEVRTSLYTAKAKDADTGINAVIEYSLSWNHTGDEIFTINASSGLISMVKGIQLTAPNDAWVSMTVTASNKNTSIGNDKQHIVINVQDINDHHPEFASNSTHINVSVPECFNTSNIPLFRVYATDKDLTKKFNTVTYAQNNTDVFHIDQLSGKVFIIKAIDYDGSKPKTYRLKITATDGWQNHSVATSATIYITDCNDNPPTFTKDIYQCHIIGGKSVNLNCTVTANDVDTVGRLSYSIEPGKNFSINSSSGQITALKEFDYDKMALHNLYIDVTASDGIHNTSVIVNIQIDYTNDDAPVCGKNNYTFTFPENNEVNQYVGYVDISDKDSTFNLSINCPGHNGTFNVYNDGRVFALIVFDYEDPGSRNPISCTVIANDGVNLTTCGVNMIITDMNDNSPQFDNNSYNITIVINETTAVGKDILKVNASDADISEEFNRVSYVILSGNEEGFFDMSENGTLKTTLKLNGNVSFNLEVIAMDNGNPPRYNLSHITINVKDENTCSPVFRNETYEFQIDDQTLPDTVIGYFNASDCDVDLANKNISYTLTGPHKDAFALSSGMLKVVNVTRYDINSFNLTITASDGKFTTKANVSILVMDTNDHSPVFEKMKVSIDITETNKTDVYITTVTATDQDKGTNKVITYSITLGADTFKINKSSGVVRSISTLDRETQPEYIVIVTATDSGKQPRQGTCTVLVKLLDVNDNSPTFQMSAYSGSIMENATSNTIVKMAIPINATDPDFGTNGTDGIVYTLQIPNHKLDTNVNRKPMPNITMHNSKSANATTVQATSNTPAMKPRHPFRINAKTGIISLAGELNRELHSTYHIKVAAIDGNKNVTYTKFSVVDVSIIVINVNDNPPRFEKDDYNFTVFENADPYLKVGLINATDDDGDRIRYKINGGDASFYIDSNTGVLYVAGNIDREAKAAYNLTVEAFDGVHNTSVDVFVTVNDTNDNAPVFTGNGIFNGAEMTIKVEENWGPACFYTVYASDVDLFDNGMVVYGLNNTGNGTFHIVPENGSLCLNRSLDRETEGAFNLTVVASDKGNPSRSNSMRINIEVMDHNDNAPVFDQSPGARNAYIVMEKSPVNSTVTLLTAVDPDLEANGTVTYRIKDSNISSSISSYFNINPKLGVVTIAKPIVINTLVNDGWTTANETSIFTMNVTVIAEDGGEGNNRSCTPIVLTVHVEPINDNAPVFNTTLFVFNFKENQTKGAVVGTCVARLQNDTNDGHLSYFLSDTNNFVINASTGRLTQHATEIDRENKSQYTLAVGVRDGRIPERSAFAAIQINILDVNDNRPQFTNQIHNMTLTENDTSIQVQEFCLTATDRDIGINSRLSFSLISDGGVFSIDNVTGLLTANGTFNYEEKSSYEATIQVADEGEPSLNSTTTFFLHIKDANDNAPVFQDNVTEIEVFENRTKGQLCKVIATDIDSGWNGKIVYRIVSDDGGPFGIDVFNGTIKLEGELDFTVKAEYNVIIEAIDQGQPSLSSTKNITILVLKIDDPVPSFSKAIYEQDISITLPLNSVVFTLDANISKATFNKTGGDVDYFDVTSSGNITLKRPIDTLATRYILAVSAYDMKGRYDQCQVIFNVIGHKEFFQTPTAEVRLQENIHGSHIIYDVNSTAEAKRHPVHYILQRVEPTVDFFFIHPDTGVIIYNSTVGHVDRETNAQYVLSIEVSSAEERHKRSTEESEYFTTFKLVVNITDVNDNPPYFDPNTPTSLSVPSNALRGTVIGKVQAYDNDSTDAGKMRYSITDGNDGTFTIDTLTGEIKTTKDMEQVLKNAKGSVNENDLMVFDLNITADDGGGSTSTSVIDQATIQLTVKVIAVENSLVVTLPESIDQFKKHQMEIIRNLSSLLHMNVSLLSVRPHLDSSKGHLSYIDTGRSDLLLYATNTSGDILDRNELERLLSGILTNLTGMFDNRPVSIQTTPVGVRSTYDPSAITDVQVAVIALAVFIFFGSLAALMYAQYSWTRYEREHEKLYQKFKQFDANRSKGEEYELDTIRSRQSSKLSSLADITHKAAVNPTYHETELNTRDNDIKANVIEYETQEIKMIFGDEPIDADRLPGPPDDNDGRSQVDSGVILRSIHTDDMHSTEASGSTTSDVAIELQDSHLLPSVGEGPVMTSSPRFNRASPSPDHLEHASTFGAGTSNSDSQAGGVMLLGVTAGDETDDDMGDSGEYDEDGGNAGGEGKPAGRVAVTFADDLVQVVGRSGDTNQAETADEDEITSL